MLNSAKNNHTFYIKKPLFLPKLFQLLLKPMINYLIVPYRTSGIHQSPTNGEENNHRHWHMSFYAPLLLSATVKKFMVGYKMFNSPKRDITREIATQKLKELI